MGINPQELLDDINNKIKSREIFKYKREYLVKALIAATNRMQYGIFFESMDAYLADQVVSQFKTILKFIYSVDNENGTIPENIAIVEKEFYNLIGESRKKYNPVRNYLEQCVLKTREIKYDEINNLYIEEHYDDYSNYARMIDKVKVFPSESSKAKVTEIMGSYLASKKYKVDIFKDRFFYSLMRNYIEICWQDSEIDFDYDFEDFLYSDIISFCAAIKLIADYYMFMFLTQPCPSMDYDLLVKGISKLADLSKDKVETFLKYQTYDYDYQKDKLTLLQGFFRFGEMCHFFPTAIMLGMLPIKMYRLLVDYDKEKYEQDISFIAKEKETQMTEDIVEVLKKYDVSIVLNHRILKRNKPVAEYDMLALDNKTNNLYICEFKWYFVGDGEKEHKKLDEKINIAVQHRKEKDKYILNNSQSISAELFGGVKINNIYELLISQNFPGNSPHDMTVIDFDTLQWGVDKYDSFDELMKYFLTDEHRKSIQVENIQDEIDIEGYKFKIYNMYQKRK